MGFAIALLIELHCCWSAGRFRRRGSWSPPPVGSSVRFLSTWTV